MEDNEINREIGVEILREAGFQVDVAVNGREAVEKVTSGCTYDLVLMDIMMPEMNGYEATGAIRIWERTQSNNRTIEQSNNPAVHRIPIIALSANASAEDREVSIAAGMDEHLAKPIKIKDLKAVLARFFR